MSAHVRRIIFNTRERLLSDDLNALTDLANRGMIEGLAASTHRRAGVLHGLQVSIVGVGLDVTVSNGLALVDTGAASGSDSRWGWVELEETETVTLPNADPANPRWDVIEIAANDEVLASYLRDSWNPALGTSTPQTMPKRRGSSPTISVRSGTPAATPLLPAGIAGVVPLAYVRVPAAAANLSTTDYVHCRPLIGAGEEFTEARGGGVVVPTAGLGITLQEATGRFPNRAHSWRIAGGTALTLATSNIIGGSLPGADDIVYFYAAPAPYPLGYDSALAGREFVPGAGVVSLFPCAAAGMSGAVVVASTVAPDGATMQGSPAAGGTINSGAFGSPSATIAAANMTYLGAARFRVGSMDLIPQAYRGAGVTVLNPASNSDLPAESDGQTSTSQGLTAYDSRLLDPLSASGDAVFPPHASEVRARLAHSTSGNVIATFQFLGDTEGTEFSWEMNSADDYTNWVQRQWIDVTGEWTHAESNGGTSTITMVCDAYRDAILARR